MTFLQVMLVIGALIVLEQSFINLLSVTQMKKLGKKWVQGLEMAIFMVIYIVALFFFPLLDVHFLVFFGASIVGTLCGIIISAILKLGSHRIRSSEW